MKTTDMRKVLVVMSIITGIMVLVVIVKFFVLDPAEENRTLNQRLLITESTVELLRDELSRSNLSFYEKDDEIARLSEEIRKLKEENAAIGGDVSDTNALIASYRDEIGRLEKELERLEKELAAANKDKEFFGSKLNNPAFVNKAPAQVVEAQREAYKKAVDKAALLEGSIADIRSKM